MENVKEFANRLDTVLSPLLGDNRFEILFNIVLVKFGIRPSTFIDPRVFSHKLRTDNGFMELIGQDADLSVGLFKTEGRYRDFVVYHKKYSSLFEDKDISDRSDLEIHTIRGERLGFPYVTADFQSRKLISVDIMLGVRDFSCPVYGYRCPDDMGSYNDAIELWIQFRKYSECLGYSLSISLENRYIV